MPFPQSDIAKQRFIDIELIGKGAFGNVYRAVDQRLRRTIAIKEIQATLSPNDYEAARQRFEHEAQIVAQLNSPHIVAVYGYDADVQQGEEYLYLEYVPHGPLAAALRERGRLTEREALLIARDLARAIAAHWSVRVVHRDIKPSSILLTRDENGAITGAKLTDYGIAQDLQATQRTRTGQGHPGTPSYMSPEQATSQRALTAASDIYNVGLLLWEMLTGTPYYEQQAAPITKTQLGTSQRLALIVQRALEPDLAKRYSGPHELVQDIEMVLAKLPFIVSDSGSKTTTSTRYGPWLWGIVGGVVLVFGIVGAVIAAGRDVGISPQVAAPTPGPTQPLVALHSSPPQVVTQTATTTVKQATATTIPATVTDVSVTATTIPVTATNIRQTQAVAVVQPTQPIPTITPRPSTPTTKVQVQLTITAQAQRAATVQTQQQTAAAQQAAQQATAQVEAAQETAQAQAQQQTTAAQVAYAQQATAQAEGLQATAQAQAAQATAIAAALNGQWYGKTSQGELVYFEVRADDSRGRRVIGLVIHYWFDKCGFGLVSRGKNAYGSEDILFSGNRFSFSENKGSKDWSLSGSFITNSEASGTLYVSSRPSQDNSMCEDVVDVTWTASKK